MIKINSFLTKLIGLAIALLVLAGSNHCAIEECLSSIANNLFDIPILEHKNNHLGATHEHQHDNSGESHRHGEIHNLLTTPINKIDISNLFIQLAILCIATQLICLCKFTSDLSPNYTLKNNSDYLYPSNFIRYLKNKIIAQAPPLKII